MLTLVYSEQPSVYMNEFFTHYWKLRLPEGWVVEQEEDCYSIFDEQGPGVLQISSLRQMQAITVDDLKEFARDHIDAGADMENVTLGNFNGITISYEVEDNVWREWYLKAGRLFLFITYHCPLANEGEEDDSVEAVLDSMQLLKS